MLLVVANVVTQWWLIPLVVVFFYRSRVGGRDRKKSPGAKQRTGSNAKIIAPVS